MPIEQHDTSATEAIAKLKSRLSNFETEQGRLSGLSYHPKNADEVIITTSPKAGTTWLQQICHQLRSGSKGGDMSFREISEVVPWLELAHDQGQDLNAPQYGEEDGMPRLFKTHAWERHCPKGCKTIVVVRDPMDVVLSFYNFFENWFFEAGTISMDDFAREFWLARGVPTSRMNNASYFVHLISWYKRRNDPNVLFLFYEDLLDDIESQVRRVAKFMSTTKHNFQTDDIILGATHRSTFDFMTAHKVQFDEKLSKEARNEACGLPRDAGMAQTKLNEGKMGYGTQTLSKHLQEEIQAMWTKVVTPVTGCATYSDLREAMAKEGQPSGLSSFCEGIE